MSVHRSVPNQPRKVVVIISHVNYLHYAKLEAEQIRREGNLPVAIVPSDLLGRTAALGVFHSVKSEGDDVSV